MNSYTPALRNPNPLRNLSSLRPPYGTVEATLELNTERYLLFAWDQYYPAGGLNDLVGVYSSLPRGQDAASVLGHDFKYLIHMSDLFAIQQEDIKNMSSWLETHNCL